MEIDDMKHSFACEYDDFILRPLSFNDIEPLRELRNRQENRKWFFYDQEIDQESQVKWFEDYLKKENDFMFAVCLKCEPEVLVGSIALCNYELEKNCFEVGRLLLDSKKMPRKHMSTDIVNCICNIANKNFEDVLLKAEVYADNERSLRAFVTNGFSLVDSKVVHDRIVNIMMKTKNNV